MTKETKSEYAFGIIFIAICLSIALLLGWAEMTIDQQNWHQFGTKPMAAQPRPEEP